MSLPIKVGMVSLGCPKNQVDAEIMLHKIKEAGFQLETDAGLSDIVIINTCGFIESAKQEAIDQILEFLTLKQEGRIKKVIVTGCLAERYAEEIVKEMPEVDAVVGLGCNGDIVEILKSTLSGEEVCRIGEKCDLPLEGERVLYSLPFSAYLKIAEGCDNRCAYCAIPSIRGPFRSRPMENIVSEAESLAARGVKELIIVAQDTTKYGQDLYGEYKLAELLRKLAQIEGFTWIRVLYAYPERITDELLQVMAEEPRIAKYLDIPLQHCDGDILKAMNRPGDQKSLKALIRHVREMVPGITLRTTLIAGFPGETKDQFKKLCQFVRDMRFDRLGCFAYSEEEGTPAAEMEPRVPEEERARRAEIITEEQNNVLSRKNDAMLGKTVQVLVEGYDRWGECWFGRSEADAPEIDGKIFFTAGKKPRPGQFVWVRIDETMDLDLTGVQVEGPEEGSAEV
ncbi:MAG: 30S ribosomal protein S12 methylthiotransferase RimO [Oscillospiraceae bacterium]|nr:30S ribosomal protein S12 methylthiotransferase RimO [Oscillospiraceae bacterium]